MDMERARQAVLRYKQVTDLPVMVQPNAGQPKLVDMKVVYDEDPEEWPKAWFRCLRPAPSCGALSLYPYFQFSKILPQALPWLIGASSAQHSLLFT